MSGYTVSKCFRYLYIEYSHVWGTSCGKGGGSFSFRRPHPVPNWEEVIRSLIAPQCFLISYGNHPIVTICTLSQTSLFRNNVTSELSWAPYYRRGACTPAYYYCVWFADLDSDDNIMVITACWVPMAMKSQIVVCAWCMCCLKLNGISDLARMCTVFDLEVHMHEICKSSPLAT